MKAFALIAITTLISLNSFGAPKKRALKSFQKKSLDYPSLVPPPLPEAKKKTKKHVKHVQKRSFTPVNQGPRFDLPITYNKKVKQWVHYFTTKGRSWFRKWLARSHRYIPIMARSLHNKGLPQDLAYVAMIESGFSPRAVSSANAVGYWQFIKSTANRYGLKTRWWIDERRDFVKSTTAAAKYLGDLYQMFDSWYLAAAAYNMGENRLKQLIRKHRTNNYWKLSRKRDFPQETKNYIPKLMAALLISKSPQNYGFKGIKGLDSYRYEYFHVPGGTDLHNLARSVGIPKAQIIRLNPELVKGFIPKTVSAHRIRIPQGLTSKVSHYIRQQL